MINLAVRVVRCIGWAVLLASVGVILWTLLVQAIGGPVAGQSPWPTPRLWRYYGTTLFMAAATTLAALLLATPAVMAFAQVRANWQRRILASLVLLPLVTMPSVFAYAWLLLSTRQNSVVASCLHFIGWNAPWAPPFQAAWVLATWLWPIPALVLTAAFNHGGRSAYHLALVDASPVRAFLTGALPVMRAPLMAAVAICFILSATDATMAPLVGATEVWSVEMLATASIAAKYDRSAGYLFWTAWPMLATIALASVAAAPGMRQMAKWADAPDDDVNMPAGGRRSWLWAVAFAIAAAVVVLPIIVFCTEMATGRGPPRNPSQRLTEQCARRPRHAKCRGSLAGLGALAAAVALIDDASWSRRRRISGKIATARRHRRPSSRRN
jgi:ABC-type Fe3+ transport system permease subunit